MIAKIVSVNSYLNAKQHQYRMYLSSKKKKKEGFQDALKKAFVSSKDGTN